MDRRWNSWGVPTMRPALPPARLTADVYETAGGDAYVIEIPVPGLPPDKIISEVTSDSLTVSTPERPEPDSGLRYIQREQPVRPMSRLFEFPVEIDTDQVRATLEHGILKIHVPKAAAGRRRVIELGRPA